MDENAIPYAIPVSIDRQQRRFSTGIRYSLDFLNLSFSRLKKDALELFDPKKGLLDNYSSRLICSSMFCDAWTMVDNINRLRRLFHFSEEYDGKDRTAFINGTEAAKNLRSVMQHPDWDYKKTDAELHPSNVLGSLIWADYRVFDNTQKNTHIHICQIHAGTNATKGRVNERSVTIKRNPVFLAQDFVLYAYQFSLDLDNAHMLANNAVKEFSVFAEHGWSIFVRERQKNGTPIPDKSLARFSPDWAASDLFSVRFN